MAFTCYLDESGTDDKNPQAVVAGLVMHRDQFLILDAVWDDILSRHGIEPPLHMKEFGPPHGRHSHLSFDERFALFSDVASLINCQKVHSVAATLRYEQYIKLDEEIKKHISVYGVCFMLCAHTCFANAMYNQYYGNLAFVLEAGNKYAEHVRRAHYGMMEMTKQKTIWVHSGSLTFEPKKLSILQAADVIAWGVRRCDSGKWPNKSYEPIAKIFNERHDQKKWTDELLKYWNDSIISP